MNFSQAVQNYVEAFQRLIFPTHCGVCFQTLEIHERCLCQNCFKALETLRFPLESQSLDLSLDAISEAWALYPYRSPLREILTAVKFQRKRWLLGLFKKDLQHFAEAFASENIYDAIVPIPLDRKRLLEREFNQTEIIGNFLSKAIPCPMRRLLQKKHSTPSQIGLSRDARKTNLLFAFQIKSGFSFEGKKILLVDDILTTGATAEEAARTLREAGAKRVDLLTLAYTSDDSSSSFSKRFAQNSSLWDTTPLTNPVRASKS